MTGQPDKGSIGVEQDAPVNAELIAGLREVADFLEQHPELPEAAAVVWMSSWRSGAEAKARARAELTAVAEALGPRVEEEVRGDTVRIGARFGSVGFHAEARLVDLGVITPPAPRYKPILAREEAIS